MQEKNYINGIILKEVVFDEGSSLINVGIKVNEFMEQLKEIENQNGWANIVIAKNKEKTDKGMTHHVYQSTFKPKNDDFF
tara:strand:+ start:1052 stop:1291 length:240 start_codon:yes stop_codon:yes gene_type:complete